MSAPLPPLRPYVPVVPGPGAAALAAVAGVLHDQPGAACTACASTVEPRERRTVEGVLLMLCSDAAACSARFGKNKP